MINSIFLQIFNMSLTAGAVIVLVLIVRFFLSKSPKILSYALWSVVVFRLLCPFSFESEISIVPIKTQSIPQSIVYDEAPQIDVGIEQVSEVINETLINTTDKLEIPMVRVINLNSIVWLAGIVILMVYSAISLMKLRRRLKGAVHDKENIYLSKKLDTPFVMGLISPKIYLPTSLSEEEKRYIILHEQTHIRRLDHVVKLLFFFALCLHWFNPMVWVAFFLCNKDMEMSCDEAVIKKLGSNVKKLYSGSLLSLASGKRILNSTPLAFSEGDTKGRIKNVLNYKKPAFWTIAVGAVAVITVGIMLIANPKTDDKGDLGITAAIREIDKDNQTITINASVDSSQWDNRVLIWGEDIKFTRLMADNEVEFITPDDLAVGDEISFYVKDKIGKAPAAVKVKQIQLVNHFKKNADEVIESYILMLLASDYTGISKLAPTVNKPTDDIIKIWKQIEISKAHVIKESKQADKATYVISITVRSAPQSNGYYEVGTWEEQVDLEKSPHGWHIKGRALKSSTKPPTDKIMTADAQTPKVPCKNCNRGTLSTTITYTEWYINGNERKCTHDLQGFDLELDRLKFTMLKCSYCAVANTTDIKESEWICHGKKTSDERSNHLKSCKMCRVIETTKAEKYS